jgi:hypothetical protein
MVGSALQMRQFRQDASWAIIESVSGQIPQVPVSLPAFRKLLIGKHSGMPSSLASKDIRAWVAIGGGGNVRQR